MKYQIQYNNLRSKNNQMTLLKISISKIHAPERSMNKLVQEVKIPSIEKS